jgi:hypothetical protein
MKSLRLGLLAALVIVPFAFAPTASAQVAVGVGIGPAVYAEPAVYGPPVCEWGYYSYYPYACAPYGYYGPEWFAGGVFIGVGPWYRGGWGRGWGYRGGYGSRGGYGYHGGYPIARPGIGYRGGAVGPRPGIGAGNHGGVGGGGFHGGGGAHGGGGHR